MFEAKQKIVSARTDPTLASARAMAREALCSGEVVAEVRVRVTRLSWPPSKLYALGRGKANNVVVADNNECKSEISLVFQLQQ